MKKYLLTYKTFEGKRRSKFKKSKLGKRLKKAYSDINNFKISSALKWGRTYRDKIILLGKREAKETRQALSVVIKMLNNKKVSENEKLLVRRQSKDILRIISASILPLPITAILVALGKKYNFEMFPVSNEELIEEIEREKEILINSEDDINESLII